jgi:hypothetical protein
MGERGIGEGLIVEVIVDESRSVSFVSSYPSSSKYLGS